MGLMLGSKEKFNLNKVLEDAYFHKLMQDRELRMVILSVPSFLLGKALQKAKQRVKPL